MTTTERPVLELALEGRLELWPERRDTWVFLAVPAQSHDAVTEVFDADPRGFRSVPVLARIDDDEWRTGVFLHRDGRWALPIEADVRRRHRVGAGGVVRVHVAALAWCPDLVDRRPVADAVPRGAGVGSSSVRTGSATGLRWSALLAMAATGFVIIVTETLPAGLLPQIADGLGIGQPAAGQLVSAYAAGTVLAALPAVTLTLGVRRKPLLLVGIAGFLLANAATAAVDSYGLALVVRFVAGAFSGLLWGITPGYARRTAPPALAGRALSIAMLGTPIALSVGTPLGAFAGSLVGWRTVFAALSVLSVVLLVWVALGVPDAPGTPRGARSGVRAAAAVPGVPAVLAVVVGWMLAHNLLYTYVAPLLRALGSPARVDVVLLVLGLAAIAGIWVTGVLVDRALRLLVLASLAGLALAALAIGLDGAAPVVLYAAVVVWGLAFGGASTQLNTAAADAAADVDVTATLITTVWNLAILGGGLLGGALLAGPGATALPWSALVLVAAALVVAIGARRRAFPSGPRTG